MLVDHDTPGVEVREIRTMSGRDELGEVLFDGVRVAGDRLIGNDGDGWALRCTCSSGSGGCTRGSGRPGCSARSMRCSHAMATRSIRRRWPTRTSRSSRCGSRRAHDPPVGRGREPGPEVSVDKVLLARAELAVLDLVDTVLVGAIEFGDDQDAEGWRHDYLFSRSAPIYGGSIEIQRKILADRVLGLPRGLT